MKLIFLYLKNNIRQRAANYVILFLGLTLSFTLINFSVFYEESNRSSSYLAPGTTPYDFYVCSSRPDIMEDILNNVSVKEYLEFSYAELYPLNEKAVFREPELPGYSSMKILSVKSQDDFWGLCKSFPPLRENEIYASKYLRYYYGSSIQNDILALTDKNDNTISFKIVQYFDASMCLIPEDVYIIMKTDTFLSLLEKTGIQAYQCAFGTVDDATDRILASIDRKITPGTDFLDCRIYNYNLNFTQQEPLFSPSSGESGIYIFSIIFAYISIITAASFKLSAERADYNILSALGIPPFKKAFLSIDIFISGVVAFIVSFVLSYFAFKIICPANPKIYYSDVFITTFEFSPKVIMKSLILTAPVMILILINTIVLLLDFKLSKIFGHNRLIKRSSRIFIKNRYFFFGYTVLNIRRQKLKTFILIILYAVPLFITLLYMTNSKNYADNIQSDICLKSTAQSDMEQTEDFYNQIKTIGGIEEIEKVYRLKSDAEQTVPYDQIQDKDSVTLDLYINCKRDADVDAIYLKIKSENYNPFLTVSHLSHEREIIIRNTQFIYKIAPAFSYIICMLFMITLLLLNNQYHLNRRYEFEILCKLGYSKKDICQIITWHNVTVIILGFLLFLNSAAFYLNSVFKEINAHELHYLNVDIPYISLIILFIIFSLSVLLSAKFLKFNIPGGQSAAPKKNTKK